MAAPAFSQPVPQWAQRRAAYASDSRGEDGSRHIQTLPGGGDDPGYVVRFNYGKPELRRRISGVNAMKRMASTQASKARISLYPTAAPRPEPQPGELRRDTGGALWRYNVISGKGEKLAQPQTAAAAPTHPPTMQGIASQQQQARRAQLMTEADTFTPVTQAKPSTLAHLSEEMKRRPKVNYMTPDVTRGMQAGASRRFSQVQA